MPLACQISISNNASQLEISVQIMNSFVIETREKAYSSSNLQSTLSCGLSPTFVFCFPEFILATFLLFPT